MSAEIAVLMPAYNADKTIRSAVDGILASTVPCDFYIVDDCSRIPVAERLGEMQGVEIIRLQQNHGLAAALNVGLQRILPLGYEYVARMDADDISYPDRLAKQLDFLKKNPSVAMVGSWCRYFDERTGMPLHILTKPVDSMAVRKTLFFNNAICHPTAMIRADVLRQVGPYSLDYPVAEDYELVRRIATRFDIANLPEVLLDYRVSSQGQSLARRRRQLYDRLRIQLKYFEASEWRAWAGVAQTLGLFAFPAKFLSMVKSSLGVDKWMKLAGSPES